jgi:uncharacterized protein GlcG (DUF336 family)
MKLSVVVALLVFVLTGCGGGSGGDGGATVAATPPAAGPQALTVAEVQLILSQAVLEAQARGAAGTIAVVDRSGNVLAVFQMTGAAGSFTISSGRGVTGGLEGTVLPAPALAAISKAVTGAYLSSSGNAFSTRTASQIVQENFNPGEIGSPGGPLFGVQFSQLSCSDVVGAPGTTVGPKSSPLGLAADPGGLPLYKNGAVVGGIGVIADALYGLDLNIGDVDQDLDELIAVAGARGFDAPAGIRADRITADGRTFRYVDSEAIVSNPGTAPALPPAGAGNLIAVAVPPYKIDPTVTAGVAFSTTASGFRPDTTTPEFAGLNAFVLDDGSGVNRFPVRAGTDGRMTQAEVTRILAEAISIANRARAQIRQPLGSPAQVTMTVVDTTGAILGLIRTPDAPVFGTDVSVQKARSALLFSLPTAAAMLNALGGTIPGYVTAMQNLILGRPGNPPTTPLTDSRAYTNRAIGNLARPFLPDGVNGAPDVGPLSKPFAQWSPFADGLQLDLVIGTVVGNIGAAAPTVGCSPVSANGIQIFPGSVPIFKNGTIAGAIGISGDGIDQDDMIAFLGLANAAAALGGIAHPPAAQRADQINVPGGQLRYVNCPVAPFLDSTATNVCNGI